VIERSGTREIKWSIYRKVRRSKKKRWNIERERETSKKPVVVVVVVVVVDCLGGRHLFLGLMEGMLMSSRTRALDLDDVFGHVDELVDQTLAVDFGQNTALIVIS